MDLMGMDIDMDTKTKEDNRPIRSAQRRVLKIISDLLVKGPTKLEQAMDQAVASAPNDAQSEIDDLDSEAQSEAAGGQRGFTFSGNPTSSSTILTKRDSKSSDSSPRSEGAG